MNINQAKKLNRLHKDFTKMELALALTLVAKRNREEVHEILSKLKE